MRGFTERKNLLSREPGQSNGTGTKEEPTKLPFHIELVSEDPGVQFAIRGAVEELGTGWTLETQTNADLALRSISPASPLSALVVDLESLPSLGIQHVRRFKAIMPDLRIIVLVEASDGNGILPFLLAGACGYLIKPISIPDFRFAITNAIKGRLALSAEAEQMMLHSLHCAGTRSISLRLTPREEQILAFVFGNQEDKAIAQALGIEPGTVHVHLANIFKKLGAHNREEARIKFLGLRPL